MLTWPAVAPEIAAALILAGGGALLAVCGLLTVRQLRAPALDRARLDALERSAKSEAERLDRLVGEAHKAAIDARRIAAARRGKRERDETPGETAPEETATPAHRGIVFRPGCDAYGNPVGLGVSEGDQRGRSTAPASRLAARGLKVGDDGALEEVA